MVGTLPLHACRVEVAEQDMKRLVKEQTVEIAALTAAVAILQQSWEDEKEQAQLAQDAAERAAVEAEVLACGHIIGHARNTI